MNASGTVTRVLFAQAQKVLIVFWSIIALAQGVITFIAWKLNADGTGVGEWDSLSTAKYFLAIYAIIVAYGFLPQFVGHGITRRNFLYGSAAFFAGLAALSAVLTVGFHMIAVWILQALNVVNGSIHLAQPWTVLCGVFLVFLGWAASGWLAGLGFYRFGTRGGIMFLPVIAVPAVFSELAFRSDSMFAEGTYGNFSFASSTTVDPGRFALEAAVAAVSVLVSLAVAIVVIRDTPIRKVSG
jgi:hypothetical protein